MAINPSGNKANVDNEIIQLKADCGKQKPMKQVPLKSIRIRF